MAGHKEDAAGTLLALVEKSNLITLETPLDTVVEFVESCKLGEDPSLPNINKYPILVLLMRLKIDTSRLPEDKDSQDDEEAGFYSPHVPFREALTQKKQLHQQGLETLWVLRMVSESPCGINLKGDFVHLSEVAIAMRQCGPTPSEKEVIPFLCLVCSSLNLIGAGECAKEAVDYDAYVADICSRIPAVADLLDPPLMFPISGNGAAVPALNFGHLPVGPNNMQISAPPTMLVAPVGVAGYTAVWAPFRSPQVLVLNASRDIGAIAATVRLQAGNCCLARVTTRGNFVWQ